jgi:uncharacterized protein YkwD
MKRFRMSGSGVGVLGRAGAILVAPLVLSLGCSDAPLAEDEELDRESGRLAPEAVDVPPRSSADGNADQSVDEGAPTVGGLDGVGADEDTEPADEDAEDDEPIDVPTSEHCESVADWDPEWVAFEEDVLGLVNEMRAVGASCGGEGTFGPAPPLAMSPVLRCSARLHSLDMYERDFFDHNNPDGVDPFTRMDEAGFEGGGGGENIAGGQSSPEQVMQSWMDSDGHCANIMRAAFDTIGIGYHPGAGRFGIGSNFWTQNFGAPPFNRRNR